MIKNIYIFGVGGFAKEVFFLIDEINQKERTYNVAGFIDLNPVEKQIYIGNKAYPVFEENSFFNSDISSDSCFAIGIGNPKILDTIKNRYGAYMFPNLIHPTTRGLFETIKFERGNVVTAGCIFTVDIQIGSFNIFNLSSTVGHDTVIGDCNVINPGVNISGGVKIQNGNLLGTNSTVLQYITIGNNSIIGAGAVVNAAIENNKVAVGVPAKVIKDNKQ